MLIKQRQHVGQTLNKADVYRIGKVALLPLSTNALPAEFELGVSSGDQHDIHHSHSHIARMAGYRTLAGLKS